MGFTASGSPLGYAVANGWRDRVVKED